MNKPHIPVLFFLGLFLFTSCEKVIDIELEEADRVLVLEAKLDANLDQIEVFISRSGPYFESSSMEMINDATVMLRDELGNIWEVTIQDNGKYFADVPATTNRLYTLEVTYEGELYQAQSYLPAPVPLLSLEPEYQEATGVSDAGYLVFFTFLDPSEEHNYYRVIHSVDGEVQVGGDNIQITDDQLFDGGAARFALFQKTFEAGSVVGIQLVHFDKASFDYLDSLVDITATGPSPNGGNAAPGNPVSNWDGGALGYFSAYSSTELTIAIPE